MGAFSGEPLENTAPADKTALWKPVWRTEREALKFRSSRQLESPQDSPKNDDDDLHHNKDGYNNGDADHFS